MTAWIVGGSNSMRKEGWVPKAVDRAERSGHGVVNLAGGGVSKTTCVCGWASDPPAPEAKVTSVRLV